MAFLLWCLAIGIINFLWGTLAYFGLVILLNPNPQYWTIYWATLFLFTLPVSIYNYVRES